MSQRITESATEGKCSECGAKFSDWFVWHGVRHCFPCWRSSRFEFVVLEPSALDGEEG